MLKRQLATVALFLTLTAFSAQAVIVAIPAWYFIASVVLHVSAAGTGLYYAMRQGSSAKVNSTGDLTRPSNVAWVDLSTLELNEKQLSAKMSHSKVKDLANSKPSTYPGIKAALADSHESLDLTKDNTQSPIDSVWNIDGQIRVVTSLSGGNALIPAGSTPVSSACATKTSTRYAWYSYVSTAGAPTYNTWKCNIVNHAPSTALPPSTTPAIFAKRIAANATTPPDGTEGDVSSSYQTELDKMFQDPDYIPTFSDEATGLPFSPPAYDTVLTPTKRAELDAKSAADAARSTSTTSSNNAATAANNAATVARAIYAASGGDPDTGTGGDQGLYQKYLDAVASATAAQAAADRTSADAADRTASDAKDSNNESLPLAPTGVSNPKKTLNANAFIALKDTAKSIGPFQLLNTVEDTISQLIVTDPSAPVFDIPMPLNNVLHIDLSVLDPLAALCRWCMAFIISIGSVMAMVKFWRGVS